MTDPELASQIRALESAMMVGADSDPNPRRRRFDEVDRLARGAGAAPPPEARPAPSGAADGRDQIRLRTLDVGMPESYQNWRLATKAVIACRDDENETLMDYLEAIENPAVQDDGLVAALREKPFARRVDRQLYSALLECIEGAKRDAFVDEIRTTVPFGSGCLALRCLDRKLRADTARARVAATTELLNLAPRGKSAAALDEFLSRFRVLVASAGAENTGPAVRTEVLQKATLGHPVLGHVLMAWRHAGAQDPQALLHRLEEVVAGGKSGGLRAGAAAWAAIEDDGHDLSASHDCGAGGSLAGVDPWSAWMAAAAAATQQAAPKTGAAPGKQCWSCGQKGHLQRNCPATQAQAHGNADKMDAILSALNKLTLELRASRSGAPARGSKKD